MKTKNFLTLFLLSWIGAWTWTGCAPDAQAPDAPDIQAARPIEGNPINPYSECSCGTGCNLFGASRLVYPSDVLVKGTNYDFAITLEKDNDCPALEMLPQLYGHHCDVTKQLRTLEFDLSAYGITDGNLQDRFVIYSETEPGLPNPSLWVDDFGTRLYTERDCIIYFKWKDPLRHDDLLLSEVSPGGICIIGIMTEPYFPPSNWSGRHPSKLIRLHPNS